MPSAKKQIPISYQYDDIVVGNHYGFSNEYSSSAIWLSVGHLRESGTTNMLAQEQNLSVDLTFPLTHQHEKRL